MPNVPLTDSAVGVQHSVGAGSDLTGVLPADLVGATPTEPTVDQTRDVIIHVEEDGGDGGGLFLPGTDIILQHHHAYCTFIQIMSDAAFTWVIAVTSGLGDGSATQVDDPIHDQVLATGSDSVHYRANIELLPGQGIRVTTATATTAVYGIVHFAKTAAETGRLIS